MGYRLLIVYSDASTREHYCYTQTDVVSLISREFKAINDSPAHTVVSFTVAMLWKGEF